MEKYIGDNKVILALSGLRWLEKVDRKGITGEEIFYLRWNYKGAEGSTEYRIKEERDDLYQRVSDALTKKSLSAGI